MAKSATIVSTGTTVKILFETARMFKEFKSEPAVAAGIAQNLSVAAEALASMQGSSRADRFNATAYAAQLNKMAAYVLTLSGKPSELVEKRLDAYDLQLNYLSSGVNLAPILRGEPSFRSEAVRSPTEMKLIAKAVDDVAREFLKIGLPAEQKGMIRAPLRAVAAMSTMMLRTTSRPDLKAGK
ncbi:MAG: hypothetical protein KGH94_04410 [Candidatus Micrarchaeota archaeon]|nr:hypothetical protein [Candidatus Micrarchaeota archaeon]